MSPPRALQTRRRECVRLRQHIRAQAEAGVGDAFEIPGRAGVHPPIFCEGKCPFRVRASGDPETSAARSRRARKIPERSRAVPLIRLAGERGSSILRRGYAGSATEIGALGLKLNAGARRRRKAPIVIAATSRHSRCVADRDTEGMLDGSAALLTADPNAMLTPRGREGSGAHGGGVGMLFDHAGW